MKKINSNAKSGKAAVEELIQKFNSNDSELLKVCESILQTKNRKILRSKKLEIESIAMAPTTTKSDFFVKFKNLPDSLAISVISADGGGSNQIERRTVDFYSTDCSFSDELIRILKLYTGTTKPSSTNRKEYSKSADLNKGYAHFCDLSQSNQTNLIRLLKSIRKKFLKSALLGRGNDIIRNNKSIGKDSVDLIVFFDRKKNLDSAWSYLAPGEVLNAILSFDVSAKGGKMRQISLGHGIVLKRYGGGLFAGDTSIKDYLQLQIQPRKVLSESTDWAQFQNLTQQLDFKLEGDLISAQSAAANRGLKAETELINSINNQSDECAWIVEECCETSGYGNFGARKPSNKEKPDVVLFDKKNEELSTKGISIKTYKPKVSFGQANRGTVETYVKDLGIPNSVAETLLAFTHKTQSGDRVMLNQSSKSSQTELLDFFTQFQKQIISHILRGKELSALKADWLLFHEAKDESWKMHVGDKKFWRLYPMEEIIECCLRKKPTINENGNLILGIGLTMQRKGGDSGKDSANDLQFKIDPVEIIRALTNS